MKDEEKGPDNSQIDKNGAQDEEEKSAAGNAS